MVKEIQVWNDNNYPPCFSYIILEIPIFRKHLLLGQLQPKHSLRFLNHKILLLPMLLFPFILPCIITLNHSCLSLLMTFPRYYNFLTLIVCIISQSFFICSNTSKFVLLSIYDILNILL